jgi:hypothetical protein
LIVGRLDVSKRKDAFAVAQGLTVIRARNCWVPDDKRRSDADVADQ